MTTIPSIDPTYITMLCDAFVTLEDIITDGELGALVTSSGIQDINRNASRHRRLSTAMIADQEHFRCADNLATFLRRTGYHIKFGKGEVAFRRFIKEMNQVLSFAGYELDLESNIKILDRSKTAYVAPEAEERVNKFRTAVKHHKLHPDIDVILRPEYFAEKSYFRAVLESMRMLMEKLKAKAAISVDGPQVAELAFAFPWQGKPVLAINAFQNDRDFGEQFAFMCLLKAFFLMFQDEQTKAYRPAWEMSLEDAINLLSLVSYFHRHVDKAKKM